MSDKKNYYFDKDVEDAIIEYNSTDDYVKRSNLYRNRIKDAIEKLVEYTVNMNKFSYYETTKEDFQSKIIAHIVEKLDYYDPDQGKAFSYFSWIAYTKGLSINKKNYKRQKRYMSLDNEDVNFEVKQPADALGSNKELKEFMKLYIKYWKENMYTEFTKDRELRIADAIIDIFEKIDSIFEFRKRLLYTMIREHSGVTKAQYITSVVKKFKEHYYEAIEQFKKTGNINMKSADSIFSYTTPTHTHTHTHTHTPLGRADKICTNSKGFFMPYIYQTIHLGDDTRTQ